MSLRHLIVATLVTISVIACGSHGPTGPDSGSSETFPPPLLPPGPGVAPRDVEDVLPSGMYTMTIQFAKACGLPASLNPMTYEVESRKGFLATTEARPVSITGSVNGYGFLKWNLTIAFEDDLAAGKCHNPDQISSRSGQ